MNSHIQENKKLQRFYTNDKNPKKRLRCALDFIKSSSDSSVEEFWRENSSIMYSVIISCLESLEQSYLPHSSAFGKLKKKSFDPDDWVEFFEAINQLIIQNSIKINRGWQNNGFNLLFSKLLFCDNHSYIRKHAFEGLLIYIDVLRPESLESPIINTLFYSIDFSPFSRKGAILPNRKREKIEGWERPQPITQEEPLGMLQQLLDFMLNKDKEKEKEKEKEESIKERFEFWYQRFMKVFIPVLYPEITKKLEFKQIDSKAGFYHHCPGAFQRVLIQWLSICSESSFYLEIIWSEPEYVEVLKEISRQVFVYEEKEMVIEMIKIYSLWLNVTNLPQRMQVDLKFLLRSMIMHISDLFISLSTYHENGHYDMIMTSIPLLEKISTLDLDLETKQFIRKSLLFLTKNSFCLHENSVFSVCVSPHLEMLFHVWMRTVEETIEWKELIEEVHLWLKHSSEINDFGIQFVQSWKIEMIAVSKLLISYLAKSLPIPLHPSRAQTGDIIPKISSNRRVVSAPQVSSSSLLQNTTFELIDTEEKAIFLFDHFLHVIPPSTMLDLKPKIHLEMIHAILEIIKLWMEEAVASTEIGIFPSTLLIWFGPWIIPCSEKEDLEFLLSRYVSIEILCRICFTRSQLVPSLSLPISFLSHLALILHSALQSSHGSFVFFTLLKHGKNIFSMNYPGIDSLIPAFISRAKEFLTSEKKSDQTTTNRKSTLQILFALFPFSFRDVTIQINKNDEHEELQPIKQKAQLKTFVGSIFLYHLTEEDQDSEIKRMCLWGLFVLIIHELCTFNDRKQEELEPKDLVKNWFITICEVCNDLDISVALTALEVLSSLSYYYSTLRQYDPSLIPHILLSLALLAQQQVEDASIEVQSHLERFHTKSKTENKTIKKGKVTKIKVDGESDSMDTQRASSLLESYSSRVRSIFQCMCTWIMTDSAYVLTDPLVSEIIFTSIQAALVGCLPNGKWKDALETKQEQQKESFSLLLLGLKIREILEKEKDNEKFALIALEYFQETAFEAEALLLHLLHHFHHFPSSVGAEQISSSCTEFTDDKHLEEKCFHFLYKNSMIFTILPGSDKARVILRDMSGTYTWDAHDFASTSHLEEAKKYLIEMQENLHEKQVSKVNEELDVLKQTNKDNNRVQLVSVKKKNEKGELIVSLRAMNRKDLSKNKLFAIPNSTVRHIEAKVNYNEEGDLLTYSDSKKDHKIIKDKTECEEGYRSVAGIYDIKNDELGIGCLDGETGVLDLLLEALPIHFPDLQVSEKRNHSNLSFNSDLNPLQTLLGDAEIFYVFEKFILKHENPSFPYLKFWTRVKEYKESKEDEKQAKASVIFWEYFSKESNSPIEFSKEISKKILKDYQQNKYPSDLFELAQEKVEDHIKKKLMPKFLKKSKELPEQVQLFLHLEETQKMISSYLEEQKMTLAFNEIEEEQFEEYEKKEENDSKSLNISLQGFDKCCLLLSQLGFFPSKHRNDIKILSNTLKLRRSLKHLDQTPSRETMKIGVLYVAQGQTTQQEILQNTQGSQEYEKFLDCLGWKINLLSHKGYKGGLDCNPDSLAQGESTFYYSTSTLEIIFHVVTQMPTNPDDIQQINKKRHIGNDFVHIVWSDHNQPYSPNTIISQYNEVQIVISPFTSSHDRMYRIDIHTKDKSPIFGPLETGMVISKSTLPSLVRATAINANRYCRSQSSMYLSPYPTRRKLIQEIENRYSTEYTEKDILYNLFSSSKDN